jgi:branched-subunit amino acid aminotransferase/4-amino-4-deoxychorismate lyase
VTRLRWSGDGFEEVDDPGDVRVIDSWLVDDGRGRAIDAHMRRFAAGCAELSAAGVAGIGVSRAEVVRFLRSALLRVPVTGRWFPRVELVFAEGVMQLQLWIRPAPARAGPGIGLWVPPCADQRAWPSVKGPDLDYLNRLRADAVAAGADEAVLLSPDGTVREGGTTSILWWRGQVICASPPGETLLPSVTRARLLGLAEAKGIPVRFEYATPGELAGLRVWAVNALHGIRVVNGWI